MMVRRDGSRVVMAVEAVLEKGHTAESEADEDPRQHAERRRARHALISERRTSIPVSTISTTVGR